MTLKTETRLAVVRGRASEMMSLGGDTQEVAHNTLIFNRQAARIARYWAVSDALARTIAEHAFNQGGSA